MRKRNALEQEAQGLHPGGDDRRGMFRVDLKGQDPETFYSYGVCLVNTGKREEAQGVFERLFSIDPYYTDGYYQLGIILLDSGNSAKAKTMLQKFVELDPGNPNAALAKEILKSLN